MLVDLVEWLNTNRAPRLRGIVHFGGHLGEEAPIYQAILKRRSENVWWIEANPHLIKRLSEAVAPYGQHVIEALVTDVDHGEIEFNLASESQASSIYHLGTHLQSAPEVTFIDRLTLPTRTIDSLVDEYGITGCNLWCFDLQGAELLAIKGGTEALKKVDLIYTEVNRDFVYEEEALIGELDAWLADFQRVATEWTDYGRGDWGDALYVRR